jgi:hypothetical protein
MYIRLLPALPSIPFALSLLREWIRAIMAGSTKTRMLLKSKQQFAIPKAYLSSQTLPRQSSIASDHASTHNFPAEPTFSHDPPKMPRAAPLSIVPLSSVIRSLAITSISSSPVRYLPFSN